MRAATRAVAGLAVAALVAAACGDASPGATTTTTIAPIALTTSTSAPAETTTTVAESTTTTTTSPSTTLPPSVAGGEVVVGLEYGLSTLNPFAPGEFFFTAMVAQLHLAGVYDIDGTTRTLVPELVEMLPTLSNGGVTANDDGTMTIRYQIRDEATWSDGVPVSGDDFQFTLDAINALSEPIPGGVGFDGAVYGRAVSSVAGPKTFELTLSEPSIDYERLFQFVLPHHAVAGTDLIEDWATTMWPSAGPFVLDALVPGQAVRFVRNENYWKTDPETGDRLPHLGAVTIIVQPDTELLVNNLINGEVDIFSPPPFSNLIEVFGAVGNIEIQEEPGPIWEHINFQFGPENRNPESLNGQLAYRQAIAHGTDRIALAEIAGWNHPIASMRSTTADPQQGPWAQYAYNPETARGLVVAACAALERDCASDPPRAVYSSTSNAEARPALAEALVPVFADFGVELELQLEDSQLFFGDTLDRGTWDIGEWAWVDGPTMSQALPILELFDPDGVPPDGSNFYRWGTPDSIIGDDPAVDAMRDILAEARTTIDPDTFWELFAEAEQLLADNAVIVPIAARRSILVGRTDRVAGWIHNPTEAGFMWNIEEWYVP